MSRATNHFPFYIILLLLIRLENFKNAKQKWKRQEIVLVFRHYSKIYHIFNDLIVLRLHISPLFFFVSFLSFAVHFKVVFSLFFISVCPFYPFSNTKHQVNGVSDRVQWCVHLMAFPFAQLWNFND